MHDRPDDRCIVLLRQIMKGMDEDSVILVDDMIIPNQGAHWQATQLDPTIMACLGVIEWTEKHWCSLDSVELKIKSIRTYTPACDSIIMPVPN